MELNQRASSCSGRADDARRARLILLLEAGCTWKRYETSWIATMPSLIVGGNDSAKNGWQGCSAGTPERSTSKLTPALEARILDWTVKRKAPDGSTQWSTRKLAVSLRSAT